MRLDDLDLYFQERARRDAFSGVALITQGPTQLFAGAYGYASRSRSVPTTLATRFDIASVTKLFTAVATLQLIERGALTFDTPVVEMLGLQGTTIAPAVTVSHLLTHTSGIADDADEERGEEYADLWTARPNYAVRQTRETSSPNSPSNPRTSRRVRGVAIATAGTYSSGCSSNGPVASPTATTCASRSSRRRACSTPISSAWMSPPRRSLKVVIRSTMRRHVWSDGRRTSTPILQSARPTEGAHVTADDSGALSAPSAIRRVTLPRLR